MVHTCVVVGCRNRRTPGTTLSFYRFPRDSERKQRWISAINREGWLPNDGSRLCSTHFISGKQVKNPRSPDYVPSVFGAVSLCQEETKQMSAFECHEKQQAQVEAATALLYLQGQIVEPDQDQDKAETMSSLSSVSSEQPGDSRAQSSSDVEASDALNYEEELRALKKENQALRESVEKMSLTEVSLRNDPAKVRFYTGLPNYFVFETVMWLLSPHMKGDKSIKLSKSQQLLLTLMRLRLDLKNQDLAYRFGVKVSTVTKTVHSVVNIMSTTLVPTTVFWPSREELRKNLPSAFRSSYPDCAVIMDCFRVALEKSDQPDANVHRCGSNALKYLIGVAPQGVVTFVSKGSPGNISDKVLVEGCGFLNKLLAGDVVLAHRGSDIGESVVARGACLKITGMGEGDREVPEEDPLGDAGLERMWVRSHVERLISTVKQRYAILTGPVESPFTAMDRTASMTTFDKIVQVFGIKAQMKSKMEGRKHDYVCLQVKRKEQEFGP
ncbi:hypothetical protein SKAU_G00260690 [Synaphobranchus kaupii]|uniref:THAP-type domain-containing protein n=1 Tax=Synaphobranchus kaupii TaxID=118154 RepID=A0A9Q1F4P4_SYNKA|nr:hypothetical protein SKAU_G00260690 [Synaphobranchus kaupii]